MEKKTSSVEYLVKEISEILGKIQTTPMQDLLLVDAIKKAKEKNREEIEEAYEQGCEMGEMFNNENRCFKTDAQQYYNETFKG